MAAIIKNNLRLLLTAKGRLFVLLILPLLIFVLGKGMGGNVRMELRLGVVNPQADPLSAVLSEELEAMGYTMSELPDSQAREAVLEGTVEGILYIPGHFSSDLLEGKMPPMELEALEGQQFMEFVRVYAERFAARASMLVSLRAPGSAQALAQILREEEAASSFREETVNVPVEKAGLILSSGFFIYLLSLNMLMVASLLQSEAAWKTLERIQRSPVRRSSVLLANVATGVVILLANLAGIALLTLSLYGEALPLPYYLVWFVYGLVWIFLGIFLALAVSLPAVYTSLTTILTVLGAMLGGAFVPRFLMSSFLQQISPLTPQYWAIEATALLGKNPSLTPLVPHFLALFAFVLLFFALGLFSQRRKKTLTRRAG